MSYNVLNKEDFEVELEDAGDKLVLVDFYANWCGPCKIINPQLEELSLQYADKAKVLKVNVDDCEEIAMAYNVTSMPTFVFIKNHQIIDILVGGNAEKLSKNMEKYVEDGETTINNVTGEQREEECRWEDEEYGEDYELDVESFQDDPTTVLEVTLDE
ncbi:thioredoxin-2-like [Calliphora vicina]|uniref:thioredoxin-2-like n=1 Tax=Calliphora vicina TaxID=7373 RepID=UPI00325B1B2E